VNIVNRHAVGLQCLRLYSVVNTYFYTIISW